MEGPKTYVTAEEVQSYYILSHFNVTWSIILADTQYDQTKILRIVFNVKKHYYMAEINAAR